MIFFLISRSRVFLIALLVTNYFHRLNAAPTQDNTSNNEYKDWSEDVPKIWKHMKNEESVGCIRKVTCGDIGCMFPNWETLWLCEDVVYYKLRTCVRVAQRMKSNRVGYHVGWSREDVQCSEKPIRVERKHLRRDAYPCIVTLIVDTEQNTDEIPKFYVSQSFSGHVIYALRETGEMVDGLNEMEVFGEWNNAKFDPLPGNTTSDMDISHSSYGVYRHYPEYPIVIAD